MGFAELQSLENGLSSLQSNLTGYRSELEKLRKRKSEIEYIIMVMKNTFSDYSFDVNKNIDCMTRYYEQALNGISSVQSLKSETESDREKDIYSDDNMNQALSQLHYELKDVECSINDMNIKINNTESQISSCKSSITAEKRGIAMDYRNKFNSAQAKVNATLAACKADPSSSVLKRKFDSACRERDAARINCNKYSGWL